MAENKEEIKECQLCHQMLPMSSFYKRKDRNGEYNWAVSYCGKCDLKKANLSREKKKEYYKEYHKEQNQKYYNKNKDKIKKSRIYYYYNNLPINKKEEYKEKIKNKYPDLFHEIFN